MRGDARLPDPVPEEYLGFAGSLGINVLCADSDGPGPHRIRISPYDPEGRVWVIVEHLATWDGLRLPLDLIVNEDAVWLTDLGPLPFVRFDFAGNRLYEWEVPSEMPDGYLEVHTFSVDSEGALYGGDNQYGRTQKFVPRPGPDPDLLIGAPWIAGRR